MSEPAAKSKAELRAERRALQNAQRAAKQAAKEAKIVSTPNVTDQKKSNDPKSKTVAKDSPAKKPCEAPGCPPMTTSASDPKPIAHLSFPSLPTRKQEPNRVHLFRHLKEPDRRISILENLGLGTSSPIHPAFIAFCVHLDEGCIRGSNETALRFLSACETLISACVNSPHQNSSFSRQFGPILERHFNFLAHCRSPTVTLHSTYQFMKQLLNDFDSIRDWEESRSAFLSAMNEFRQQSIYLAGAEIAERASAYIRPGDCVCTFGYSSVVARVLLRTFSSGGGDASDPSLGSPGDVKPVPFSVLVVDTRPNFNGRRMSRRLASAGIPCEYTHIAALPSLAHKVSLAIVGADALLNNGYVLACIGTAQLANIVWSVARAPTLVCAETYKFWERAHSDAFEFNELGDPDDVWRCPRLLPSTNPREEAAATTVGDASPFDLKQWRSNAHLHLLQLSYDVLPPSLVSAVITEKGTLPTTSVPVVLRVKNAASIPL